VWKRETRFVYTKRQATLFHHIYILHSSTTSYREEEDEKVEWIFQMENIQISIFYIYFTYIDSLHSTIKRERERNRRILYYIKMDQHNMYSISMLVFHFYFFSQLPTIDVQKLNVWLNIRKFYIWATHNNFGWNGILWFYHNKNVYSCCINKEGWEITSWNMIKVD
jgi:hypothetical protein